MYAKRNSRLRLRIFRYQIGNLSHGLNKPRFFRLAELSDKRFKRTVAGLKVISQISSALFGQGKDIGPLIRLARRIVYISGPDKGRNDLGHMLF